MPYYIAFDLSHKPRGKIDDNYIGLRDHLNANDFICYNYLETPITVDSLKLYDIIVFACPDFSKISPQEVLEIVNWVKDDGGGLLLLSHAGDDRGRSSNLSELSEHFGIAFENDQVLDDMNNAGMENLPIITAAHFIPPHPITDGLNEICYRAGCSLTVVGGAMSVVYSNETSEPFSCPLICVSEQGKGRVCAIGTYEMFRDRTGGGFQQEEHANLVLNVFKWLVTDHRMEVTEHGTVHKAHPSSTHNNSEAVQSTSPYSSDLSAQRVSRIERIDPSIKFNNKDELLSLLSSYLNQIDTIKQNIESLVKNINASGENLFEPSSLQTGAVQEVQYTEQPSTEYYHPAIPAIESEVTVSKDQGEFAFSALPSKPQAYVNKVEEEKSRRDFIGLEPVEFRERDTVEKKTDLPMSKIKEKPKPKVEPKKKPQNNREELEAELEGLESKLNSVFNLLSFIEKKHDSGKIDDKSYKKQAQKLQKDLEQTKKRIEEIRNNLEG